MGLMAGVWLPPSRCHFWVLCVLWLRSQECVRSEPGMPKAVPANDAWVHTPVYTWETICLIISSRRRIRVWGSLLSSPFFLARAGKHGDFLTQTSDSLQQAARVLWKAPATLCSPWELWWHHRESLLQPRPGDAPCSCIHRSSGAYPLSMDKHTAFLTDNCMRGTSKSIFLSEIQPFIPTTNHPLKNFRSPSKYRGVIASHIYQDQKKKKPTIFFPFYSQTCLKFSGHHFPKDNN